MAKQKKPEQRSTAPGAATPDPSAPQPTGEETFSPSAGAPEAELPPDFGEPSDVLELQALAAEYYGRLAESASHLTQQAREVYAVSEGYVRTHPGASLGGTFVLGLLLGLLSGRN